MNKLLFTVIIFLVATSLFAQEEEKKEVTTFKIDGEFRSRFESSPSFGGRNVLVGENTHSFNSIGQRARITTYYDNKKMEAKFSFQDVRMFGENKNVDKIWSSTYGNGLAVHEAWAMYKFINKPEQVLGIKIGRQELKFADARLMWNKDWLHQAASHDAVNFQCRNKNMGIKWDLGFSLNSVDMPGQATPFSTLGFINISKSFGKNITINVTDLYEGMESDDILANGKQDSTYYRNTVGLNPVLKLGGLTFNGSFYMQMGELESLKGNYAGMMYTANISYNIVKKYKIGIGYDSYSGNDGKGDDNKAFITPYAGAHKFFGNTDMHLKLFGKGLGLNDINVKADLKLLKTTSVSLQLHLISLENNLTTADGTEFTEVGNNFDLVVKHKFDKKITLIAGYSLFMPSDDFVKYSFGDGNAKMHNFAWIMFSFKPNFFKSEK